MDPSYNNSFGSFSSGGAGGQPGMVSSAPDTLPIIVGEEKKSKKKWWVWVLVGLLFVGFIVIAVALNFRQGPSSADVYSVLWNFYYETSYQDLIESYDFEIGKVPHLQDNEVSSLFPVSGVWIESTKQKLEVSKSAYNNEISGLSSSGLPYGERKKMDLIKNDVGRTIDIMASNLDKISGFYDAFIVPLNALFKDGTTLSCFKTDAISALTSDAVTSDAAEKYFSVYCKTIEAYYKVDERMDLQDEILSLANEAINSLNLVLDEVNNASEDEILNLLSELSK